MPWFKVDDTLAFHAKVVAAGNAAMGLWLRAGSWSAQTLTEGFIPDHMVSAMNGTKSAPTLVQVRLWDRVEGGYAFRGWVDYQPTREQVESEREAARIRQQRARDKAKQKREAEASSRDSGSDGDVSHGVSHGVTEPLVTVPPTRPDPTNKKEGGARKRGTRLPENWLPNAETRQLIASERPDLDLRAEHQNFCDYWHAEAGQKASKLNWDLAWRRWMRNQDRRGGRSQQQSQPVRSYEPPPPPDEADLDWDEIGEAS